MNYTDIDDKTVARSQQKYPADEPMAALKKLTKEYIDLFHSDMQKIGNRTDNITFMAATDNIGPMQALIAKLYEEGFAYVADDGVYFSIDAYRKSGKTYGQLLTLSAENTSEARIQNDEYDKESVHDFALWKTQKPGEPAWEFELDGRKLTGRPGWHIECSAMSRVGLGQPFDLHTGGVDNIFPHHENEIAQSTAGQDNPMMAHFFAHNEHLLVDGKKMAKSANNFYTLEDIVKQGFDPLAFRLLILQSHYRSQAQFSFANLEAAKNRLQDYQAMAALQWQATESTAGNASFMQTSSDILEAMQDDLNTPTALAHLSAFADEIRNNGLRTSELPALQKFLAFLDTTLGLSLSQVPDINDEQKQIIKDREHARTTKDWEKSDQLRDQLAEQRIGLQDTPSGQIWYKT